MADGGNVADVVQERTHDTLYHTGMNSTDSIRGWRRWWLGVRPATLGLSLVPVFLGSALGLRLGGAGDLPAFLVACLCVLCIQAGTNLFNDAGDGARGADGPERLGPPRLVGSGLATVAEVRHAAVLCFGVALAGGLYLAARHGSVIIVIGLASLLAGWLYSGGPRPLSHTPWGESFVLLFFGLVAVAGSCYLQTGTFSALALLFGVVPGSQAAAVLLVNNTRDLKQDSAAGRTTLASLLGERAARSLYALLVLLPFALLPWMALELGLMVLGWAPLILLPQAFVAIRRFAQRDGRALNQQLEDTARLQAMLCAVLVYCLLWGPAASA